MNVTVIGGRNMGSAFVKQLHAAGHQVCGTARSTGQAEALAAQHGGVRALSALGAASDADAVIVATRHADATAALRSVGNLAGKVGIAVWAMAQVWELASRWLGSTGPEPRLHPRESSQTAHRLTLHQSVKYILHQSV